MPRKVPDRKAKWKKGHEDNVVTATSGMNEWAEWKWMLSRALLLFCQLLSLCYIPFITSSSISLSVHSPRPHCPSQNRALTVAPSVSSLTVCHSSIRRCCPNRPVCHAFPFNSTAIRCIPSCSSADFVSPGLKSTRRVRCQRLLAKLKLLWAHLLSQPLYRKEG